MIGGLSQSRSMRKTLRSLDGERPMHRKRRIGVRVAIRLMELNQAYSIRQWALRFFRVKCVCLRVENEAVAYCVGNTSRA